MNTHASRCCGLIAAALTILACADSTPRAGDNAVRDSAGVTIVESVSPDWTNETAWLVDTTAPLVYGEGEPVERQPLDPASVFRTAAGEVVVADGNQSGWHNLLVYDANGRWLRTLGRQGQGPCEFSQVWWAAPYRGDSIAVFDMGGSRMHVLGSDGGCGGAIEVPRLLEGQQPQRGGFVNEAYAVYPDGTFLMAPMGGMSNTESVGRTSYKHDLVRVDRSGTVLKVLGKFQIGEAYWDGRSTRPLFHGSFAQRALDGFDLVYGTGNTWEIQRIDTTGSLAVLMRRVAEPRKVTRRDQERILTRAYIGGGGEMGHGPPRPLTLDQRIDQSHWAEFRPAHRELLIDPAGNTWAENYRLVWPGFEADREEPAVWSVFAPGGAWLGDVTLPPSLFLKRVYDDVVFGMWQDEAGVRTVRSYRLLKS